MDKLQQLKNHINYDNVYDFEDHFNIVLKFDHLSKVKNISGKHVDSGYVVKNTPTELKEESIVITFDTVFNNPLKHAQYWSKNGVLHREGKPAFNYFNIQDNLFIQRWYENGIPPAKKPYEVTHRDLTTNNHPLPIDPNSYKTYASEVQYSIRVPVLSFFSGAYEEYPGKSVTCHNVHTLYDGNNKIRSFECEIMIITWDGTKVDGDGSYSKIHPYYTTIENFQEVYDAEGNSINRKAIKVDWQFINGNSNDMRSEDVFFPDLVVRPDSEFMLSLLDDLDIWGSGLFTSEEAEFIFLTEYDNKGTNND